MKKLTLDMDALSLASFTTGQAVAGIRGTLRGNERSQLTGTETYQCPTPTCPTYAATCLTCAYEEQ
jgi:hypothetical protein